MIVVAEQRGRDWSAWFEGHPEITFGGDSAATAAIRLIEFRGLDPTQVRLTGAPTMTQMELLIPTDTCPVCKGTKMYVGLQSVEPCSRCGGIGEV